jgi:hypothetical protein
MDFGTLESLRSSHPAWRLLRAENGSLIASFLHRVFLKTNVRRMAEEELSRQLDDDLFRLRRELGDDRFPKSAKGYLTDWADDKAGWLRKRYIAGTDEAQFDLTPSTEAALSFLASLVGRAFIGTESRLRTVFDLLRSLSNDTETDFGQRKAELLRKRAEIDAEIARLDAGHMPMLDDAIVRDRFYLIVETAQSLLGDFRAVEENFRTLDRDARVRIATWDGAKGELLERIFGDRDAIAESDQGRSFKAFYDLLMSTDRQDELTRLLDRTLALDAVRLAKPDKRIRRVHFDWLMAAEATQGTVAKLSAELRRYLDDKVWLENRRIMSLLRDIESRAHAIADDARLQGAAGEAFMELEAMAPNIVLAMDRPLFRPPHRTVIAQTNARLARDHVPADALFDLVHVDRPRLEGHIRYTLQHRDQVTLTEIVAENPLELGLAELVAYLSIASEDEACVIDETQRDEIAWIDDEGTERRAAMPQIIFVRDGTSDAIATAHKDQEVA